MTIQFNRIAIQKLNISTAGKRLLHDLDIAITPGECIGLVGESGSGKSLTALTLLGLLPRNLTANARLSVGGQAVELFSKAHDDLRGNVIAWIPQDPLSSLHPLRNVGSQIREILSVHMGGDTTQQALKLFERVQLPEPRQALKKYPHQFSGGQRQRIAIAMALASQPKILIADEPTSALDARIARDILELIDQLRREDNLGVLLISHDLPLVGHYAQQVVVLQKGEVMERGATQTIFADPQHEYTKQLLAADHLDALTKPQQQAEIILQGNDITVQYPGAPSPSLYNVQIDLFHGEGMVLVGESGSGKSTLGRALLRLLKTQGGSVRFNGDDLLTLDRTSLRKHRANLGIVFQDPYSSLNPRMTVKDIIAEPLRVHGMAKNVTEQVAQLLLDVGLTPDMADRYPHQFSGGQRQRIAIARALATQPQVLICDEAVSALDAHYRASILDLLAKLKRDKGVSLLFITHDLVAAAAVAERIAVLENGHIVERGYTADILTNPQHPHTQALINARP